MAARSAISIRYYLWADDGPWRITHRLHQTTGWSVTGGIEHHWNPAWKTSLFGDYGQMQYDATASGIIVTGLGAAAGAAGSANWNYTQVGSRTVWTTVANLDLSVELMYNNLNTGFGGSGTTPIGNLNWVSGMFRVQRNFWP
jgi:hypothetical protein